MAQQRHVVDAVASGDHPRDQRHHLAPGVGALIAGYAQLPVSQAAQPGVLGELDDRDQPHGRHEIWIIKDRCCGREPMKEFHLRDALRNR